MAFKFPWTNLHEINLDWIVEYFTEIKKSFEDAKGHGIKNPFSLILHFNGEDTDYDGHEEINFTIPNKMPNPQKLKITTHGTETEYDGSAQKNINFDTLYLSTVEQELTEEQKNTIRENIGANTPPSGSVRYDTAQSLTEQQKTQARTNIGANTPATGSVRYDTAQSLTDQQKAQARDNIGAGDLTGTVRYDTAQSLTDQQKTQARNNIGAQSIENLVTDFSENPSDTKYPSEKLVADNIAELGDDVSSNSTWIRLLRETFAAPKNTAREYAIGDYVTTVNSGEQLHVFKQYSDITGDPVEQRTNVGEELQAIHNMTAESHTQKTYNPGDYVIYNNKLWKCLVETSSTPSVPLY